MNEIKQKVFRVLRSIVLTVQNAAPPVDTTGIVLYAKKNGAVYELYYIDSAGVERHVTTTP